MARVSGKFVFTGTAGNICFYLMDGKNYARKASSLTGKRVKKDKAFTLTMVYAGLFGRASRIGSKVYRALPRDFREFWMYRAFTGEAMQLLKQAKTDEEVTAILMKMYAEVWVKKEVPEPATDTSLLPANKPITPSQKGIRIAMLPLLIFPDRYKTDSNRQYRRCGEYNHSPPTWTGHKV